MSTMTGERQSPGWRKPSDVMKIRKKKKLHKTTSVPTATQDIGRGGSSPQRPGIVLKRRNPFGCGGGVAAMKRKLSEDCENEQKEEIAQLRKTPDEKDHCVTQIEEKEEVDGVDKESTETGHDDTTTEEEKCHRSGTCPIDWCLHTRIRFTSQVGFDWSSRISSLEESRGLTNFVRCSTTPSHQGEAITEDSVFRERLQQSTKVWSSPSLPWFKSFPRIVPESKDARTTFIVKEENVQKSLMAQWCESFCSIYQLLRAEICPYFYVCAHHLTILFRAKHVAGREFIHALLGPTTRGFRESLKAEGVTYTMPLLKEEGTKHMDPHQKLSGKTSAQEPSSTDQDNDCQQEEGTVEGDGGDEDSEAASWLESIGLNNFLEMSVHKVQLQADTSAKQDNRPQSALFVEGFENVQALYNFILNYKNIVATVGLQAGIPPTILAPFAFHGATLSSCKVKSGCLRQVIGHQVNDIHTLQVSGPILPHNVHQLTSLLSDTQQGQFTTTFQAHGPTGAFTAASHRTFTESGATSMESEEITQGTEGTIKNTYSCAGFSRGFNEELFRPENVIEKAWNELKYVNSEYQWPQ